jgi:hypothetical protein
MWEEAGVVGVDREFWNWLVFECLFLLKINILGYTCSLIFHSFVVLAYL